ncbi:MAG: SDR family oxidoreductase [Pseudomonadota bacterium]
MSGRLEGKRAFCTAAAAGIGRSTALRFAIEGANVVASDIDADGLEGLREEAAGLAAAGSIETRVVDVRERASVDAAAREVGAVDVLFNAAGYVHHGNAVTTSDDDWLFSFDLGVHSAHRVISAFLPAMIDNGGGSIVNIASAAGATKAVANRYAYTAVKAAVVGLTKAVAFDFIAQGIRCNAICPGTVDSPSLRSRISALGEQVGGEARAREMFIERQPMGRLGTAEEVAALAVYLAGDESAFTTGQAMIVDGGFTL